jgi:hypothetical protein
MIADLGRSPVLYVICCAAPPALRVGALVDLAQQRGWEVCLIVTPTAALWLSEDLHGLEELTGHPVCSNYKLPVEPDVLPPADAFLVAPATFNTINKWALGIADTLALGMACEALGKGIPIVAVPWVNSALAAHPALDASVKTLQAAGVTALLSGDDYDPGAFGDGKAEVFPWDLALSRLSAPPVSAGPG